MAIDGGWHGIVAVQVVRVGGRGHVAVPNVRPGRVGDGSGGRDVPRDEIVIEEGNSPVRPWLKVGGEMTFEHPLFNVERQEIAAGEDRRLVVAIHTGD